MRSAGPGTEQCPLRLLTTGASLAELTVFAVCGGEQVALGSGLQARACQAPGPEEGQVRGRGLGCADGYRLPAELRAKDTGAIQHLPAAIQRRPPRAERPALCKHRLPGTLGPWAFPELLLGWAFATSILGSRSLDPRGRGVVRDHLYSLPKLRPTPCALGWPKGQAGVGRQGCARPKLPASGFKGGRGQGEGGGHSFSPRGSPGSLARRAPARPWRPTPLAACLPHSRPPHVTQQLHERHSRVLLGQECLWAGEGGPPALLSGLRSRSQRQTNPEGLSRGQ